VLVPYADWNLLKFPDKDHAPRGYEEFDQGAASKYVLDPHGMIGQRATG
jgi:hypothetical protein